jgi:hypothetical protein
MQPSENPYASPSTETAPILSAQESRQFDMQLAIARRMTWFPAMGMLVCSMTSGMIVICAISTISLFGIRGVEIPWLSRHLVNYWYLYFIPFTSYFAASFFGSLSLLKCQNRVLAKIGCMSSLIPLTHPLFPVAMWFAVKGLFAMRMPEVQEALKRTERDERSMASRASANLFGPASILLMFAWLTMFSIVLPSVLFAAVFPYLRPEAAEQHTRTLQQVSIPRVSAITIGASFVTYAAIQMLRGRQYVICVIGAFVSMIPFLSPCIFFGIPFGLWALVILLQKETRIAFAEPNQAS